MAYPGLIVYHSDGVYQVNPKNGSYTKFSNEAWSRLKAAAYDNDNSIYAVHDGGIFRMRVDSGTYTTVSSEGWYAAAAAVYARGSLIVFHADGIFRVNPSSGSYTQISNEAWLRVKAAAYDNENTIAVFHDGGIFLVCVDSGSYRTLSWRGWSATRAAVYARNSLIVFYSDGIFRVNPGNGAYEKISSENWSYVRAATYDGDNMIIVFHDGGIFRVSVDDGSYTAISREGWSSTKGAVYTNGKLPSSHVKESRVKETRGWGVSLLTSVVVFAFLWAEYGPVVGFRWKVLRGFVTVVAILYLARWSSSAAERPKSISRPSRSGVGNASSESSGDSPENQGTEVEDPIRWTFLPSGCGVLRTNTRSPVSLENDNCSLKSLALHRPTHETWRESMGNYPYSFHFSGRRRVWEVRLQFRFKTVPTNPLYFGIEMRYVPFTLSPWMKQAKNLLLKAMSTAIGGEIYQTPGEDPASVEDPEPPTVAFPMWAIDQFHVADPGEEPDIAGDLEGVGLRRSNGLRKYIQALKEELQNISTAKIYTFCFWGVSQFADAIHWEVRMSGFKLDVSKLCGEPPVYICVYDMPGVKADDDDRRHLISRKRYYAKVAVWNASKPFEEEEVRSLEASDGSESGAARVTKSCVRAPKFGSAEWFAQLGENFGGCGGTSRCTG